MAYVPLATQANLSVLPLFEAVRDYASTDIDALMVRGSRAVESFCGRRLSQFTGLTETGPARAIPVDEMGGIDIPLDQTAALGVSRASAFGTNDLVRHFWVKHYPPQWSELWQGSVTAIRIWRDYSGYQDLNVSGIQFEPDTGHIRFQLGTFLPSGSTVQVTYGGGYNPVPDDLIMATLLKVAELAIVSLTPEDKPDISIQELQMSYTSLLVPYVASDSV